MTEPKKKVPAPKPKVTPKVNPDTSLTFWNGVPVRARRVRVIVADNGSFPNPWFKHLVGEERAAVEVTVGEGVPFYLDNAYEQAWLKITEGRGASSRGSSSLDIKRVIE